MSNDIDFNLVNTRLTKLIKDKNSNKIPKIVSSAPPIHPKELDVWLKCGSDGAPIATYVAVYFDELLKLIGLKVNKMPHKLVWYGASGTEGKAPQLDPDFIPDPIHINTLIDVLMRP